MPRIVSSPLSQAQKMVPRIAPHSRLLLFLSAAALTAVLSMSYTPAPPEGRYHSDGEYLKILLSGDLPVGDNEVFIGSGKCAGCHGIDLDGLDPVANQTSEGIHVSPSENWRATMMANSAKDPFWRAKVAHEVSVNPGHAQELVNKCTSCHAPVGRFTALHFGQENYSMEELENDSLALDGVNCGACHQLRMENLGNRFSGELAYHTDTIWGPYISEELEVPIFSYAMSSFVGYEPVGDHRVSKSEFCAGCHSLLTHTVNLSGEFTGGQFVEQATYHEWLNSSFSGEGPQQKECQGCHMPRLDEPIVIASGYSWLPAREPFSQHWLVGGNTFMLELMQNRISELGITATEQHFDAVLERTMNLLTQETATLELTPVEVDGDTARFSVRLRNLAGHKFPSGYPSRRAYIEFSMTDADGNVLFRSGELDAQYDVIGQDPAFEPHYDLITSEDQVQIYEMVMGDVNGNVTTVLERAAQTLKDNRLVPLGFSVAHAAYDTTRIVGSAAIDADFNHEGGAEGSGTDEVRYHIPVSGIDGMVTVTARLMYQSVPPKWNEELFATSHPVIDAFEEMYWEEGPDPVEVAAASESILLTGTGERSQQGFRISPNPAADGVVWVRHAEPIRRITVYEATGRKVLEIPAGSREVRVDLPDTPGAYLLRVETGRRTHVRKVLRP